MSSSFTLSQLAAIISPQLITTSWVEAETERAKKVAMYRRYQAGDHDAKLTPEMRRMLRLTDGTELNANYCDMVISTMSSRLAVDAVNGDTPEATQWFSDLMRANRFDALQADIHEDELTSGETYLMVSYDAGHTLFSHEPAYDGTEGVLAVWDVTGTVLQIAIKIWQETDTSGIEYTRVNVYYADRVEKYDYRGGFVTPEIFPWVDRSGQPLGVPLVPFRNRAQKRNGISEIKQIVPLQNALNRTLVSMIMTGELSAFQVRYAKGFETPSAVAPGVWIEIPFPESMDDSGAASLLNAMDVGTLEQSQLVPFISQYELLVNQIATISRTPIPELMGSAVSSGEALKQRESGLLGKVRAFQIKTGNAWEDVASLAWRVDNAFSAKQPPANEYWAAHWKQAELRNETELVNRVMLISDKIGDAETLRLLAPVFEWDPEKVMEILEERRVDFNDQIAAIGSQIPPMASSQFEVTSPQGL